MSEKKPDPTIAETWICVGHCVGGKGQEVAQFQPVDLRTNCIDTTEEPRLFDFPRIAPGSMYEVKTNENRTRASVPRYRSQWPEVEDRARWQLQTKATRLEVARLKSERKALRDDALLSCLEPIRRAYQKAPYYNRHVMEMIVLEHIRRPLKG